MQNKKFLKFSWVIPTMIVAFFFMAKLFDVWSNNSEFVSIISTFKFLIPTASLLALFVGLLDFIVGLLIIANPWTIKNYKLQKFLFLWIIFWPFLPSSIRYFSGVGDFEILEISGLTFLSLFGFYLWNKYYLNKL